MYPEQWKHLTKLAEGQHSLVTVSQVRDLGVGRTTLDRDVERGLLVPYRRGVLAIAGAPDDVWRPLMSAFLAADRQDVAASHRAAAGLLRFPGILPGAVELTGFGRRRLELDGARCHTTTSDGLGETTRIGSLRATGAARTIVDLAGELDLDLLRQVVAHACRRRLCSERDLDQMVIRRGGRGRAGTTQLRGILADRSGGDSGLEDRWLRILTAAGLRPPAPLHQIVVGGRVLVLDFAWPRYRVGVEVDGWAVHRERHVWDRDHDKVNAYLEAGWRVLFITSRTRVDDVLRQLHLFMVE